MGLWLKKRKKPEKTDAAVCDATPLSPPAPPDPPPIRIPVLPKRSGHTTRSPLPHDLCLSKPIQTINGGKDDKEYIRYRLTPEELQALKNAYPEKRCQNNAYGSRRRDCD